MADIAQTKLIQRVKGMYLMNRVSQKYTKKITIYFNLINSMILYTEFGVSWMNYFQRNAKILSNSFFFGIKWSCSSSLVQLYIATLLSASITSVFCCEG